MQIYLMWSGETSRAIAAELREWLPRVVQRVVPFFSEEIEKGTEWFTRIANNLQSYDYGIAVVTAESLYAPWLCFEAGALFRAKLSPELSDTKRIAPILFGVQKPELSGHPLDHLQVTAFSETDMFKLVNNINNWDGSPIAGDIVQEAFAATWPSFLEKCNTILDADPATRTVAVDPIANRMEEILREVRDMNNDLSRKLRALHAGQGGVDSHTLRKIAYFMRNPPKGTAPLESVSLRSGPLTLKFFDSYRMERLSIDLEEVEKYVDDVEPDVEGALEATENDTLKGTASEEQA